MDKGFCLFLCDTFNNLSRQPCPVPSMEVLGAQIPQDKEQAQPQVTEKASLWAPSHRAPTQHLTVGVQGPLSSAGRTPTCHAYSFHCPVVSGTGTLPGHPAAEHCLSSA